MSIETQTESPTDEEKVDVSKVKIKPFAKAEWLKMLKDMQESLGRFAKKNAKNVEDKEGSQGEENCCFP